MEHAVNGTLDTVKLEWDRRTALGVVMAAAGYPDAPRKGDAITGIPEETAECVTFHAGTTLNGNALVSSGGRVLCVVGLGDSVKMAQKAAYAAVERIHFDGAQFRRDIGWRALKRHG
jgi:phosphoribosylamine--glycine ligase